MKKVKKKDDPIVKLTEKVAVLETNIDWIVKSLQRLDRRIDRLDRRIWWVLGSVVVLGVLSILISLLK